MPIIERTTVEVTVEPLKFQVESECFRQARDEVFAAYPDRTLEPLDEDHSDGHHTYRWSVA